MSRSDVQVALVGGLGHGVTARRLAWVRMNPPSEHNAYRLRTLRELEQTLDELAARQDIGAILLTGDGTHFSAGWDWRTAAETQGEPGVRLQAVLAAIRRCPMPVVAVVRGYALGGGQMLHVACDVTVAAQDAIFGHARAWRPGDRVGGPDPDAAKWEAELVDVVGRKRAREILMSCRQYAADQALQMGLINAVATGADLDGEAERLARQLATGGASLSDRAART